MTAILSQQLGLNSSLKVSVQIWIKIFCCYINVHVKMILSDFLFDMLLKWQSIFRLQFFESLPNWKENSVEPFGMTFCWFDNFDWFLFLIFLFVMRLIWLVTKLCLAAQSVEEWSVWEETIFIFWVSQFGEEGKSIFFWDLIS